MRGLGSLPKLLNRFLLHQLQQQKGFASPGEKIKYKFLHRLELNNDS
jgi:hypothetical protein